jgi:hypothetical protein
VCGPAQSGGGLVTVFKRADRVPAAPAPPFEDVAGDAEFVAGDRADVVPLEFLVECYGAGIVAEKIGEDRERQLRRA